jgi:hypothetical protein
MATPLTKQHKDLTGSDLHEPKPHAASHHFGGSDPLEHWYTQVSPATLWTITHNLGRYPAVTVVDSAGTPVIGKVIYVSANQVTVTFTSAFSGKAYLT